MKAIDELQIIPKISSRGNRESAVDAKRRNALDAAQYYVDLVTLELRKMTNTTGITIMQLNLACVNYVNAHKVYQCIAGLYYTGKMHGHWKKGVDLNLVRHFLQGGKISEYTHPTPKDKFYEAGREQN